MNFLDECSVRQISTGIRKQESSARVATEAAFDAVSILKDFLNYHISALAREVSRSNF